MWASGLNGRISKAPGRHASTVAGEPTRPSPITAESRASSVAFDDKDFVVAVQQLLGEIEPDLATAGDEDIHAYLFATASPSSISTMIWAPRLVGL